MAERSILQSTNPATGETFASYPVHDRAEVEARLDRAGRRRLEWRAVDTSERARLLHRSAALLRDRGGALAELMAREMGKPFAQGVTEAEKCAWACEHFAEHGAALLAPTRIATDAHDSYVSCQPLGAVLGVMPWNFPLWQVFRFAAPTLMAGNVVLLKHASNVPGCAEAIAAIFADAGFPDAVFTNLAVDSRAVDAIIANPIVAAVSLTGSRAAGSAVAASAGAAIKKSVLELGGSDPYLVLEDADLELAARACAQSRLINSGQSCIAAKRFIVVEEVIDEFTERLLDHLRAAVVGDPLDDATDVGPLARVDLRDALHQQVADSVAVGARCLLGGAIPDGPGAWYPVTVFDRVTPGMPVFDDETFGPVAAIVSASSAGEAVRLANAHRYGLGAAVFTRSTGRGRSMAERDLEAGFCVVNDFVRSDPRLPFGGVKESGYGRELGAIGIREFVNEKTIYVA